MKKPKKQAEPTESERTALRVLMFDSMLFSAHPVVHTNVRVAVGSLLRTLGREDLAALWEDPDAVSRGSTAPN